VKTNAKSRSHQIEQATAAPRRCLTPLGKHPAAKNQKGYQSLKRLFNKRKRVACFGNYAAVAS
jgi:hypothetical protein